VRIDYCGSIFIEGYVPKAFQDPNNPYADIVFQNPDASYTRLVLQPPKNNNLDVSLGTKYLGSNEVIGKWNQESVITMGTLNEIVKNENWRIDQQGTSSNGPDGKHDPVVKAWANLQLQYGGTSKESWDNAKKLREKKKPTSIAEVHAPVGVTFTAQAFQRAFAESKDILREGGAQVWMYRVERNG